VRIPVLAAAAISPWGAGWRGLGQALAAGAAMPGVPDEQPLANPRARKMMSRGAYLAARCVGELLRGAAWPRAEIGYFLGVGASGGSLDDMTALLAGSIADGAFSLERFGEHGLAACNPLLAFQLMNNFTLCHGAILEGIGGPNAAMFSRGAGTVAALIEAVHAVAGGDCVRAIAGGADSAIHPVMRAELARDGFVARGLIPSEGAAMVALGAGMPGTGDAPALGVPALGVPALGVVEGCAIASGDARPLGDAIAEAVALAGATDLDLVVIAPWGPPAAAELRGWAHANVAGAAVVDSSALGDALAASPALAWLAALDLLASGRARRALVLGAGTDGDVGAVVLARGAA
jgi:3-oxoacyl-(acyl-carrier-protein) synthase